MLPVRWVASYPRSGNKVTRVLLANYLTDRPATNEDMGRVAPDITSLAARGGLLPVDGPERAVGGTFLLPDAPLLRRYGPVTGRVLYMVRDPRAVIPSAVRQLGLAEQWRAGIAKRLLAGGGITDLVPGLLGPWEEHVLDWTSPDRLRRHFPEAEVLVMRFEDLKADPVGRLREIVGFLELDDPADPERVDRAMENVAPDRMRAASVAAQRPDHQPFVYRPEPDQQRQPQRPPAELQAEIGQAVQDAYREMLERDGDFARCVREFGYEA